MLLRYLVIASLVLVGCAAAQDATVGGSRRHHGPVPLPPKFELRENSSCTSDSGDVTDLRDVVFLRDTTLPASAGFSPRQISVDRQTVLVGDSAAEGMHIFDVGPRISGENALDVELALGLLRCGVVIHWRETFQHRRYRQGLLHVIGDDLVSMCEGISGITVTH